MNNLPFVPHRSKAPGTARVEMAVRGIATDPASEGAFRELAAAVRERVAWLKTIGRSEAEALEDVHRIVQGILPGTGKPLIAIQVRDRVINHVSFSCFEEYHRDAQASPPPAP